MRAANRRTVLAALLVCIAAACGQKGPLTLPTPPGPAAEPVAPAEPDSAEDERQDDE